MIIVADNLRITLPTIARAVQASDPTPIRRLALACRAAGADAIDINSGPLSRHPEAGMTFLVQTVQAVVDLPLVLDTTNAVAMAAGLAACRRRPIINGVSLEADRLARLLPLARQTDADLIAYLLTAEGHVPTDAAGRMESAVALFGECQAAGIDAGRLIVDPVVAPLVWPDGNRQNMAVLEVIRTLPDLLGFPVRTIAGLSNLTSGAPDRKSRSHYQRVFLPMLAAAGVDVVLMNVLDTDLMATMAACRKITTGQVFAWR